MFICSSCSETSPKWVGKCPKCSEWNTYHESTVQKGKSKIGAGKVLQAKGIDPLSQANKMERYPSSSGELDAVLGGGLSAGSLVLLSGEPGIGKSTLALQMSEWYASRDQQVLYISGEEHIGQISARAVRLGVSHGNISLLTESDWDSIFVTIERSTASIIIIDSLSVLSSSSIDGSPGSISQIRIMTEMCMHIAKKMQKSIILIGHVTKDGSIGGPKSLEHLVDVVLFLEGVRTENYRILRALKNRFGPTDSVGLFRMEEKGLIDLPNPGMEFIDSDGSVLSGSALTFTIEGNRPILIEIEALTTHTKFGYPKRSARGLSQGKLDLLIAVMSKFTSVKLEDYDTYLNIARGIQVSEPGVDLACIAAISSSKREKPLGKTIYLGEVSLTGVVKNVMLLDRRLMEAAKLGFTHAVIPASYDGKIPKGMECTKIKNVKELQ
ncbi:DNA repair protein RadA [Candidatus Gracilibacteria bacterium]|nr:DNA repair protein RadA [Candidatus Gracilibacteria bacterium]